jgi:hypothetical protein
MNKPIIETENLPVVSDSSAIIQIIERAAMNPEVDMDKMERLLVMKERMDAKEAESLFNKAMTKAQSEMKRVSADAQNPQTRSKYASYAALDKALRPIYTEHGFALSFDTNDGAADGLMRIVCHLSHIGGHSRSPYVDMPADGKGARGGDVMTKTHAAGSAMSYGMRYLLKMIFNVAVGENDDDGNGAEIPRISEEQANEIYAKIDDNGLDMGAFMGWLKNTLKCDAIENLSQAAYGTVINTLNTSIANKAKK